MQEQHLEDIEGGHDTATSSTPQVGSEHSNCNDASSSNCESGGRSESQTSSNSFHDDGSVQSDEQETTDDSLEIINLSVARDSAPSSDEEDVEESENEERVLDPDGELDDYEFEE
ncbi:hypothetical protein CPC08DRAFT_769056 [Agrocybe pediades]|nr:hypothetical protein CPC08DRAFT_769056 [Agrocybe pediades]